MAAYSAVISLLQTLEQRNKKLIIQNQTAKALESIHATAQYFHDVLEGASYNRRPTFDPDKTKSLEEVIRVAATDAEDVVDLKFGQFIKVSRWTFGMLPHWDLLPLVEKMDTTKKQVMEILEVSGDLGIDTSFTSYASVSVQLGDDVVHGLDYDLEIIVNRLTGPSTDLDIVTITDMGGIGKTTLAKKAYDHFPIRYRFDILAWVTVSQEFRGRNVYLQALHCISKQKNSVNEKDYDKMDESELADLLQKNLKRRRYLVVVDDIWRTDVWDRIRRIFPNDNNRSRILLTTRETEVAMYADTSSPYEMNLLTLENGWKLLCHKVFGPKHDHPPELEDTGKEIVKKCQGLPLTISVIAGHLCKMSRTLEGWKDVARTLSEVIATHSDKCLEVVGLSYHHLPNCLKPCFLSMAGFLEDFQIDTRRLIQLWIAEGFIKSSEGGKSLEEVAADYLEDLISRNLIQARKRRFNGEIKTCGIHDLLREFCLIEAEMTKHMHVERTYPTLQTQKHNVRRFSFQALSYSVDDCCKLLPPVTKSIYLFSLLNLPYRPRIKLEILPIYRRNPVIHDFFSRFNLLRVLAILNTNVMFRSFPLVITKLFHLRYLQIQFDGDIPESISELQKLQFLICSGYPENVTLPEKIWMMKNFKCISLARRATYLPSPRRESILNKHLVTWMPNLEGFFGLSYASCTNEVFSGIPNLKRLIIRVPFSLGNRIPYRPMDMSSLGKLEAFKFYGLHSLENPIKSFVFPTSLRRLSLTWLKNFIWEDISSTVIMLPHLEELKLKRCRAWYGEWRFSDKDKFRSLKLLLLRSVNLRHLEASSDNFPNLKHLVLKECNILEEIPIDFGEICTLESIELHDCSATAEDSAREIEQEQEDMGNSSLKVYIHQRRNQPSNRGLVRTPSKENYTTNT
ncbi:putative late blight resistance protein R1A-3 isoform X1 [Capsicum chacoense]